MMPLASAHMPMSRLQTSDAHSSWLVQPRQSPDGASQKAAVGSVQSSLPVHCTQLPSARQIGRA